MRAICSLKLHADGNVEDHIVQMKMLFSKLQSLGEKMTDSWLISMLLSSLPSNYDILITALEVRNENDLTLSMVEDKLLEQYQKQRQRSSDEDAAINVNVAGYDKMKSKKSGFCHNINDHGNSKMKNKGLDIFARTAGS